MKTTLLEISFGGVDRLELARAGYVERRQISGAYISHLKWMKLRKKIVVYFKAAD
jgi:hypothetical protein